MICVFCESDVPTLLTLAIPGFNGKQLLLIAFLVVVVQGSDMLQYVFVNLFGRRKVAPTLSPPKTWEGLVGGVLSASALGTVLSWMTLFSPLQAGAIALLICLMGFFGGLVISAIKRDCGVKDWGRMIEGHGGMLDRINSVIFAAPVTFHITRYWFSA
ncbi:COG4589 Predicted CDP-diglyceride synthetase/phosphatidate cytidylyltransferase [Rhabdaerophilaceae bacterium]